MTKPLNSWLIITGEFDSHSENAEACDPGGYQRVHWNDLLGTLKEYGVRVVNTVEEMKQELTNRPEVVVLQGHSSLRDPEKGVFLVSADKGRIYPAVFPELQGCKLLWLSTCHGEQWLDQGLREQLPDESVVVGTSSTDPDMYSVGDAALKDFMYKWMSSFSKPWSRQVLEGAVKECLDNLTQHERQSLKVLKP